MLRKSNRNFEINSCSCSICSSFFTAYWMTAIRTYMRGDVYSAIFCTVSFFSLHACRGRSQNHHRLIDPQHHNAIDNDKTHNIQSCSHQPKGP